MAMDSDTPSYQSLKTITATTHSTVKMTLMMLKRETITFFVAMSRIKKAKQPDRVIPKTTPS